MPVRKSLFAILCLLLVGLLANGASAFQPMNRQLSVRQPTTALSEGRIWNFNEGQSPWGLKKNAEVWNGRVAQMAFTFTFFQELVQGKGVIEGLSEGDPINIACMAGFFIVTGALTIVFAIKGNDDYVTRALRK